MSNHTTKPSNGSNYQGEIHRLDEIRPNFDISLFNDLYQRTASLRKTLSYQVDANKFGLDQQFIEDWFSDKFLYVFNKYFNKGESEDAILAKCINSMKMYKNKILNQVYRAGEEQLYSHINLEDVSLSEVDLTTAIDNEVAENRELIIKLSKAFLEDRISREAYTYFKLVVDPPAILKEYDYSIGLTKRTTKIPLDLLSSLLDIGTKGIEKSVKLLRREIKNELNQFSLLDIQY